MPSSAATPSPRGWRRLMKGAVRNTRDVDLLVRREDLPADYGRLEKAGFTGAKSFGVTMFLDGPDAKPSESIHLLFAGEKVKDGDPLASPDIVTIDDPAGFRVLTFESLVRDEAAVESRQG